MKEYDDRGNGEQGQEALEPRMEINVQKLVLNVSIGESDDPLAPASKVCDAVRSVGIRRDEKIACYVTVRVEKAMQLLESGLKVKKYELLRGKFSDTGCFGFSIQEHIDRVINAQYTVLLDAVGARRVVGFSTVTKDDVMKQIQMKYKGVILHKSQNI